MDKSTDTVVGHEEVKAFFKQQQKKGFGGRCYLFEGKKGIGKRTFAEYLAFRLLQMQAADFSIYYPTGKSHLHPIETLKNIKEEAMRSPQGSHLMIVIDEAEKMAASSSQSLLKILEEPPVTTIFVLVTENKHKLLPTILSRCQIIPFKPLRDSDLLQALPTCTSQILNLASGSFGKAKDFCEKGIPPFVEQTKDLLSKGQMTSYFEFQQSLEPIAEHLETDENRQLFFSVIFHFFRDLQLKDLSCEVPFDKILKAVKHAKFSFDRFTSAKQVLETLFLEIYG